MTANLIKAKGAAFKLHREFGIQRPSDIRVEDIAMEKDVFIAEADLNGAEARLVRQGNIGMVRINISIQEPGRKRFAASHELGHWQMHEKGSYLCTAADMADYKKSPLEIEANAFAAEFLMPTFLFRPFCKNKAVTLDLIEEIKIKFNTTLTATALRMIEIDEVKANCMVVLIKNRLVERYSKSQSSSLPLHVAPGTALSPKSVAYYCEPNPAGIPKAEKVPFDAWFDHTKIRGLDPDDWTVYEQSMQLGNYPTILTILHVSER
jgi:Zn-dependent peptidase ImmA (M78 family)